MNNETFNTNHIIKKIKQTSLDNNVAILRDDTIKLLLDLVDQYQCKTCLEIGSGTGYSASILHLLKNMNITTIEKDASRFKILEQNLKNYQAIECINIDCFQYHTNKTFDLIIIDGPKANQIALIQEYINHLNDGGIMFIDNIYLKKFTELAQPSKNQQKIINHIKNLQTFLNNYDSNKCKIYNIDDGVAIILK